MTELRSTREGFHRATEWSLTGPPEEAKTYAASTTLLTFYHLFNGQKLESVAYLKSVEDWRAKVSDYRPNVDEFLRDGNQLAAHMTGTIKVDGTETFFENLCLVKSIVRLGSWST